jgi:hypothetical protein
MNRRLNDLHFRRGRLLERVANQRAALSREARPVRDSLARTDRLVARVRSLTAYVKQHPSIVTLAVAVLFITKPRRVWRWSKRGFIAWRTWRVVRENFLEPGLRARS